ncbi:hypothetical protein [Streptomyces sp. NPDC058295]|uniref:hypothetical protein n=1 Tax=Streptomyces sp. NPDC058295 TaxID=3346431 RepID=UPI0036E7853C
MPFQRQRQIDLRKGLGDLLTLTGLRVQEPDTADEVHEALVRAVADGDPETAAAVLAAELEDPFGGRCRAAEHSEGTVVAPE